MMQSSIAKYVVYIDKECDFTRSTRDDSAAGVGPGIGSEPDPIQHQPATHIPSSQLHAIHILRPLRLVTLRIVQAGSPVRRLAACCFHYGTHTWQLWTNSCATAGR